LYLRIFLKFSGQSKSIFPFDFVGKSTRFALEPPSTILHGNCRSLIQNQPMSLQRSIAPVPLGPGASHLAGIDVIRGLCIMDVVLHHTNIRIPFAESSLGVLLPHAVINALFWTGDYSVKIFFVISGFLITNSILARWPELASIDCLAFYRLRFARIAPCLLTLLAILTALHFAGISHFTIDSDQTTLWRALFAALTFHINWLEARVGYLPGSWDVLWSLSVEETFYFAFPLLCRFVRNRSSLLAIAALLLVLGPFARTKAFNAIWEDYSYLGGMDCIAIGCVTAIAARTVWVQRMPQRFLGLTGGLLILSVWFRDVAEKLGLLATGLDVTILALGAAMVILAINRFNRNLANNPILGGPVTTVCRWYGRNSYEVYLTHMFVVLLGAQLFRNTRASIDTAPFWFMAILATSGLLGFGVSRGFSEPMNRRLRVCLGVVPTASPGSATRPS
jgi:peptidoglycan/LPS O-acetylase OafA/YrhL